MAFGGLFRRMILGLEAMRCREGSLFSYTSGIGDSGALWTYRENGIAALCPELLVPACQRESHRSGSRRAQQPAKPSQMLLRDLGTGRDCRRGRCRWRLTRRGRRLIWRPGVELAAHRLLDNAEQISCWVTH